VVHLKELSEGTEQYHQSYSHGSHCPANMLGASKMYISEQ
jgi:hypothetical protein